MSLIQEALRRKDDENAGVPPKTIPVIPVESPQMLIKQPEISVPPPSLVSPIQKKTNRAWPVLMISLLVITILSLAAVGLLLYSARSLVQSASQTKGVEREPVVQPAPVQVVETVPLKVEAAIAKNPEPVLTAAPEVKSTEPASEVAVLPETIAPTPAAVTSTPVVVLTSTLSNSTEMVQPATTEKKPNPVEVSVVPVSGTINSSSAWPTLKVVGVMAPRSTAQPGAAMIDGNLVECGDEIRGVQVEGVDKSGVWFQFRNQTQYVRVGQTTR